MIQAQAPIKYLTYLGSPINPQKHINQRIGRVLSKVRICVIQTEDLQNSQITFRMYVKDIGWILPDNNDGLAVFKTKVLRMICGPVSAEY